MNVAVGQLESKASEWRLHWRPLLACVAAMAMGTIYNYSLGVMIGPLEKEFGWTRAQISSGPLILACIAIVGAPMVGALVDRVGPRRVGLFGVLFFCSSVAMLSTAGPDIRSWWLLWVLLSVSLMFVLATIWTAAVSSLFIRNRGMALAITLSGTGVGSMFVPMLTEYFVETHGWRWAYIWLAVIGAGFAFPLIYFFMTSAADAGRRSGLIPDLSSTGDTASKWAALGSLRFLKLACAAVLIAFGTSALIMNAVPILIWQGFEPAAAAKVAGLLGLGAIIGRLGGGFLLDRFNANHVAGVTVLTPMITSALLIVMPGSPPAASLAMFVLGLAMGTELDACAYLTARHFGLPNFGKLFGMINGLLIVGNALAPLVANYIYDVSRTYSAVLWALFPASIIAATLFFRLGPYPALEDGAPVQAE